MGRLIPVGIITSPWGIKGHVKIFPLTDFEERLSPGERVFIDDEAFEIEESRKKGRIFIVKLSRINSRNDAENLRGKEIKVPEEELKELGEGEFYPHNIIGLRVVGEDGDDIGEVRGIIETPSNFVLQAYGKYGEVLIPFIEDVIKKVDVEGGIIVIEKIKGLLP